MEFKASLNTTTKIITIIGSLILIGVNLPILFFQQYIFWVTICILALTLVIFIISWGFSTKGYKIENQMLVIKRPLGNKNFALKDFQSIERIAKKDLRFSLRVFGNGGLFGYYGKFYNRKFGKMTWFVTNLNNSILIKMTDGKKIVVTPDEPESFLNLVLI